MAVQHVAMTIGVLIVGFGGPTPGCCGRREYCSREPGCEAECFVSKVLGDDPRQRARIDEVTEHYTHLGGFSLYNERTEHQRAALAAELEKRGSARPVAVGYRNWTPFYADGLRSLREQGCDACVLLVMAPHQCSRSWEDYLDEAQAAADQLGEAAPRILGHADVIHGHPGFTASCCRSYPGDNGGLV